VAHGVVKSSSAMVLVIAPAFIRVLDLPHRGAVRAGSNGLVTKVPLSYVDVMAIKRITLSVPAELAVRVKRAAGKQPVSAWVTDLIEEHLEDADLERLWDEFYQSVRPRPADVRRAESIFRKLTKRGHRVKAA